MIKTELEYYDKNISFFQKSYIIIIFFCFLVQLFLSNNLIDYYLLSILTILNLIIVFYCFNKNSYNKFPLSFTIIFLSIFSLLGSSLIFKTLELHNLSKGLFLPFFTTNFLFLSCLLLIFTHYIYVKKNINIDRDNILLSFNKKIGLFENNEKFLVRFGFLCIILMLLSRYIYNPGEISNTLEEGLPIWYSVISGLNIFYIIPFILIFSKSLFYKENKINHYTLLIFFVLILIASIGSNRRDVIFFGLINIMIIYQILFLMGREIISKKNFLKIFIIVVSFILFYDQLLKFNYVYLYERGQSDKRSFSENIISFKNSYSKYFSSNEYTYYIQKIDKQIGTSYGDYYENILYERLSVIEYADNIFYNKKKYFSVNEIDAIRSHQIGRLISIFPSPIINLINNKFDKKEYIFETTASKINNWFNPFYVSRNDVGSFIAETYFLFGYFSFVILIIFSAVYFYIIDSFFNKSNGIFSIILLITLFHSSTHMAIIFAAPSFDTLIFNLRNIIQIIILFKLFEWVSIKFMNQR
jgi:hypothetical protein